MIRIDLFFIIAFPIVALTAVYIYYLYSTTKEKLYARDKDLTRKLFELQILKEVNEKTGFSLKPRDIAEAIAVTAEKILPLSSVSYALIESDHITLNTIIREKVGQIYLQGVKDIVLQGIFEVDANVRKFNVFEKVIEDLNASKKNILVGLVPEGDVSPKSYFNIPLVLNEKFIGVINISSTNQNAFQQEDMSMLYKVVDQAHGAIDRLETVIKTEKGKVDAMVKSLSSGAIYFSLENNKFQFYMANNAARRFLDIKREDEDILNFLSTLPLSPNLVSEMQNVILQKKCTIYRKTTIGNVHLNIYISPVFRPKSDEILGVAITLQDITAEVELEKLRANFTNVIVHELRAPLTSIKGASTLLMEKNLSEADQNTMKQVIRSSSERLLGDISEILDSAKIDSGKMNIIKADADINEVVASVSQQLAFTAREKQIIIENEVDKKIPLFEFDSQRIGQVLINLISNSIKFTSFGGKILISSQFSSGIVTVSVKDNGAGIPPDKFSTLFKPFSQLNSSSRSKGTGLGLYIAKAIIEAHGGAISISSKVGEGTTISFTLPVVHTDSAVTSSRTVLPN